MTDPSSWLAENGLEKYAHAFSEAEITLSNLPDLTEEDLKELGLPLGPRRTFHAAIKKLSDPSALSSTNLDQTKAISPLNASSIAESDQGSKAERRQLTVMFVDLVGSTVMAGRLDPEDMRNVITNYQNAVAGVVSRHEGFVANFMGDGVLCYFGWPRADEDDAERAVRAGLSIIDTVKTLKDVSGTLLATRIGIATGLVVVGDLIGSGATQEAAVVGETPNLAARLQGIAKPNQIVLPKETQRLLGSTYVLRSIGDQELKGIKGAVEAFAVEGESVVETRFAAQHSGALTPIVGRDQEIELILQRWALARSGRGQLLVINGEAGIGKSRIVRAVIDEIRREDHIRMTYQCSHHHADSALYPVIQQMSFAAGFTQADSAEARLDKLESLLGADSDALKFVAPLMGLDGEGRYSKLDMTPAQQRYQTLQALVALFVEQAKKKPLLLIYEDLHWIDPTSLELLDLLLDATADQKIMILSTARPTFEYGFSDHPIVTWFALNRLRKDQISEIVVKLADGKTLPDEIMEIISERTDGIPLFVEELTKTVLESGAWKDLGDRLILDGKLSAIAIPSTLHGSLMTRLDRLGSAKKIAQIGAAIGREFGYSLVESLSEDDEASLKEQLDALTRSQLVFARGVPPTANYRFKHALVQDAAYESLLKSARRELHHRIGAVLEERFPETVDNEPEILAHHYTNAGLIETAVIYWHKAGKKAIERSANVEAISHLGKGIDLLRKLPSTVERNQQELDLQMALGTTLMLTKGIAAPEVEGTFDRALELCEQIDDIRKRFLALWGVCYVYAVRSPGAKPELAFQLHELAEREGDQAERLVALRTLGSQLVIRAEFSKGLELTLQGLALYDPDQHRSLAYVYGQDVGVVCRQWSAWALWFLGYPDQALSMSRKTALLAQETSHPMTEVYIGVFTAMFHRFRREMEPARKLADNAARESVDQGFELFLASANAVKGSLLTVESMDDGIALMKEGVARWRATGAELFVPFFLALLAEAYGKAGRGAAGLAALDEAMAIVDKSGKDGERLWDSELLRIKGELLLGNSDAVQAEACFQEALQIASRQGAKSWELRTSVSLSLLWKNQGRRKEAQELLKGIYGWFTEGFDTPDLINAKALLEELSHDAC